MATEKQIRATLQAYADGWQSGDKEAWLALFADDARLIDPVGTDANIGKEAIAAFWDRVTGLGMKMRPEVQRIVVCGGQGVLVFTMNTVNDAGMGMAVDIVDIFELDEAARITTMRAYWDNSCMRMVQLDDA